MFVNIFFNEIATKQCESFVRNSELEVLARRNYLLILIFYKTISEDYY